MKFGFRRSSNKDLTGENMDACSSDDETMTMYDTDTDDDDDDEHYYWQPMPEPRSINRTRYYKVHSM